MKHSFRGIQDGMLHLCFSENKPTTIQVMVTEQNTNFLRKLATLGQVPRQGEHVSVYFKLTEFHYKNDPKDVRVAGYFCRNSHQESAILGIHLLGTYDMVEEAGSLEEFKEHLHIPSESFV